jgi:hypothetical protein
MILVLPIGIVGIALEAVATTLLIVFVLKVRPDLIASHSVNSKLE